MEKIARLKIYYNLVSLVSIFLLAVLLLLQSIWVIGGSSSAIITQVSLQSARVQAITKDVLLLGRSQAIQAQAISELQDALPSFEKTQASLQKGSADLKLPSHVPDEIVQAMALTQPDYVAFDIAANNILIQAQHNKPADPIQLAIVLGHEHGYSVAMMSVRNLWIQHIDNAFSMLFYLESGDTLFAIITVIIRYFLVRNIPALKETEEGK